MSPHTKNQILAHLEEVMKLLAPSVDLSGPRTTAEDVSAYVRMAHTEAQDI